jgi:CheY-like chemotaxis protein
VLVIEDDEISLELVTVLLERMGHDVTGARSAEEAAGILDVANPALLPALVIVDVRLPGHDGHTLTRQLRTDPRTASIPVLALTAHASLADRDAALDAGCTAWMTKPLDTRLLAQTLLGLL